MRQEHEIDSAQIEIERPQILPVRVPSALEQAAVDEKRAAVVVQTRTRAGNFPGSAEKCQFQAASEITIDCLTRPR